MEFSFTKYQGAGNDFVVIDDRKRLFDSTNEKYINFIETFEDQYEEEGEDEYDDEDEGDEKKINQSYKQILGSKVAK